MSDVANNNKISLRGNALAEYILPAVLLTGVVVASASHSVLQGYFQKQFSYVTAGNLSGKSLVIPALGNTASGIPAPSVPSVSPTRSPDNPELATGAGSAPEQAVATLVNDNVPAAETVGGMGGANKVLALAERIQQVAQQMKTEGAPDWLTQYITDMAKDGHLAGNRLKDAWMNCPPDQPCKTTDWSVFGTNEAHAKNYLALSGDANGWQDPSDTIFFITAFNTIVTGNPPPGTGSAEVWQPVLAQYPEARQAIIALGNELLQTAKANGQSFVDRASVVRNSGSLDAVPTAPATTQEQVAHDQGTIRDNANDICTTGGDGQKCLR